MSIGTDAAAAILQAFSGDVGTVPVTFTRQSDPVVSVAGKPTHAYEIETPSKAFVLPPSEGSHMGVWGNGVEPGTLSASEYAFLWVAASGMEFAPKAGDTLTIGVPPQGEEPATWRVLGCDPYALSGVDMAYAVGVRKQ